MGTGTGTGSAPAPAALLPSADIPRRWLRRTLAHPSLPSLHLPEILQRRAGSIWQRGPRLPPPPLAGRRRSRLLRSGPGWLSPTEGGQGPHRRGGPPRVPPVPNRGGTAWPRRGSRLRCRAPAPRWGCGSRLSPGKLAPHGAPGSRPGPSWLPAGSRHHPVPSSHPWLCRRRPASVPPPCPSGCHVSPGTHLRDGATAAPGRVPIPSCRREGKGHGG